MDERMAKLLDIQDKISLERNLAYENNTERVLVDSYEMRGATKVYSGRTLSNKLVYFEAEAANVGEFIKVRIEKACPFHLLGTAENK